MIDDIEFNVTPKTVKEYRIYKNGSLAQTFPATTTRWSGNAGTNDVFFVTAVYEEGESAASNI